MKAAPLDSVRVLDLSSPVGTYCTRILADLGADVVLVEPPEGDTYRGLAPFRAGASGPDASLAFGYYQAGKRSIVLDVEDDNDRAVLERLGGGADVVVISPSPTRPTPGFDATTGTLTWAAPDAIVCSVTPFGVTGPYAHRPATHFTSFAQSGAMWRRRRRRHATHRAPAESALAHRGHAHGGGDPRRARRPRRGRRPVRRHLRAGGRAVPRGVVGGVPLPGPPTRRALDPDRGAPDGRVGVPRRPLRRRRAPGAALGGVPRAARPPGGAGRALARRHGDASTHLRRYERDHRVPPRAAEPLRALRPRPADRPPGRTAQHARAIRCRRAARGHATSSSTSDDPRPDRSTHPDRRCGPFQRSSRRPDPHRCSTSTAQRSAPRCPQEVTRCKQRRDVKRPRRPLDGVRVLSLGEFVASNFSAQILAALGAEVVKIESRSRPSNVRTQPFNDSADAGGGTLGRDEHTDVRLVLPWPARRRHRDGHRRGPSGVPSSRRRQRRRHRELRGRRHDEMGMRLRRAAAGEPAAGHGVALGVRPHRTACRLSGVRLQHRQLHRHRRRVVDQPHVRRLPHGRPLHGRGPRHASPCGSHRRGRAGRRVAGGGGGADGGVALPRRPQPRQGQLGRTPTKTERCSATCSRARATTAGPRSR